MSKIGIALEGGGAKGAYHVGVYKAYLENGYKFDGFVGTSIGAINAAAFASADFETTLKLWENISLMQLFDEDVAEVLEWETAKSDGRLGDRIKSTISKVIAHKGIDTTKIREFITPYIDEEKIRQLGLDVGLVTYSTTDWKPHEIFVKDVPEGKLIDYIMASTRLPGFKAQFIDDKKFIDGGIHDNWPVNMLINKGYDEIIAVRTNSFGKIRSYDQGANVTVIRPVEPLTSTLAFSSDNSANDIRLGYLDGLKAIHKLQGQYYYLRNVDLRGMLQCLVVLNHDELVKLKPYDVLKKYPGNRLLLEYAIPELARHFKLPKKFTYDEFLIAILEYTANKKGVNRYQIYDFDVFLELLRGEEKPITQVRLLDKIILSPERELFIERLVDTLLEYV
ncbi:MAG: patatin-like phospholipase family protein [Defluviitaleaceae bacterium]|nr:patatin-like phospholipase family protein [Defluviitaleaceae bacterium]